MKRFSSLVIFALLLLGSGLLAYRFAFQFHQPEAAKTRSFSSAPVDTPSSRRPTASARPLLLQDPPLERVDPTHYEVTVSDLALQEIGKRIEREAKTRLEELTDRYQLSANQRRETFPLLVSHHPDYRSGLVVNGFSARPPGPSDFASQFSAILNLNQQELFQEDLGADRAWWRDVLSQIREDLEGTRLPPVAGENPDDLKDFEKEIPRE